MILIHLPTFSMNALAGSVPQGASFIPFLPYSVYAARILFPHFSGTSPASLHPVLRELTVEQDRALQVESSLRQLHCLLQNRIFLLCFVRSIDANKYLLVKDRVYVGSLLMVVLQVHNFYLNSLTLFYSVTLMCSLTCSNNCSGI